MSTACIAPIDYDRGNVRYTYRCPSSEELIPGLAFVMVAGRAGSSGESLCTPVAHSSAAGGIDVVDLDLRVVQRGGMHIACGSSADRRTFDKVGLELSALLHRWDPIGVYDGDAPNPDPREYDDLVVPLLDQLRQSSRPEAPAGALEQVLADDYGLPKVSNVDGFAATVARWWREVTE